MEKQTYIIAGGGCSGLSVALQLAQNAQETPDILIIDREKKTNNDRTWCFWAKVPPCPSSVIHHSWKSLSFADRRGVIAQSIAPYTYYMVRSADWYAYMWSELEKYEQVRFVQSSIHQVGEDEQGPFVRTSEGTLRGDYVLNSVQPGKEDTQKWPTYQLWQHFAGWWIETDRDAFDPEDARLMDFRPEQHGDSRFMYVLPYSRRHALVEFTVFSKQLLGMEEYEREIAQYMEQHFPGIVYSVIEKEGGKIPMTNKIYRRYQHPRVLNIGTVGGAVKPTTGYAFLRIQSEAQQLTQKLLRGERAVDAPASAVRFTFYDRLLLHILTHHGHRGAGIFSALFRANPMRRILTFLNEQSTLWQEIKIFAHLPYGPFLRALGTQLWYRCTSGFARKWYQNWTPTSTPSLEQEHQIIQQKL